MTDGHHLHLDVSLTVSCCDPAEASQVAEKLARVMTGLALDGHEARMDTWRFAVSEEDEELHS